MPHIVYLDEGTCEIESAFKDAVCFVHVADADERFHVGVLSYVSRVKLLSRTLHKSLAPNHRVGRPPKAAGSLVDRLRRIVPAVQRLIYTETGREQYGIFDSPERLNVR